jgi:iron complex transport system substrate-binding protein
MSFQPRSGNDVDAGDDLAVRAGAERSGSADAPAGNGHLNGHPRPRQPQPDTSLQSSSQSRHRPRIASLVPHATELLFALGLGPQVVAVTHECDYPEEANALPRLTRDVLPPGLRAAEIDAAVRARTSQGEAIYELDELALAKSDPDIIVTQALCPVCAVSYEEVVSVAQRLPSNPQVISLDPHTVGEVLGDIRTIAEATGQRDRGVELVAQAADRIDRVKLAVRGEARPRVVALEWLDPVFVAGHWTPQIIDIAGGEDVLGMPGEHSQELPWEVIQAAAPDVVLVIPCGYDAPRAHQEAERFAHRLAALRARLVVAVDASAFFSRPGPRLIDGLELLASILHPQQFPATSAKALTVDLSSVRS